MNERAQSLTKQRPTIDKSKQIYIYSTVNIDNCFTQVIGRSRKIKQTLQSSKLPNQFLQTLRKEKNFRICFDAEIQRFIHRKELLPDCRTLKKNVFESFEKFIVNRINRHVYEEALKKEYDSKVKEIEEVFLSRIEKLLGHI